MPKFLTVDEIRRRYIEFFVARGHKHVPSDSLVPQNDPSVLFTGAGMNQFKDNFLGRAKLDHSQQRATTCQKVMRAGDIDNVGRTPNHHTFFEMLGNFSFGDYFKKEAIEWGWTFATDPNVGLGMEKERISVTIFGGDPKLGIEKDTEAEKWWKHYAPELQNKDGSWRIYEYGEHDNFWPADAPSLGPNGPCGPCSEMYFDMKPEQGAPEPVANSKDPFRYVEFWNLVFTQFNRVDVGKLEPLSQKNIDTGSGLERAARVLQGKPNNYETDLLFPIVQEVSKLCGKAYGKEFELDRRMRRITDHTRAAVMAIADGVVPDNEGRNYVIRRLMRRAILDGRELGIDKAFLGTVARVVIKQMSVGYPELLPRTETLVRLIEGEERAFGETINKGRQVFDEFSARLKKEKKNVLSGADAFRLYDTFGFPLELTIELADAAGLKVDEAGFKKEMEEAVKRSQSGSTMSKEIFATGPITELKAKFAGKATLFKGYNSLAVHEAKVLAIIQDDKLVEKAHAGEALVLLDQTPFYAESGGQVGDHGYLYDRGDGSHRTATMTIQVAAQVLDTQKFDGLFLHRAKVRMAMKIGDVLAAEVDIKHRGPTLKNHSATHLLHNALRSILGTHVEQRGSLVKPDALRFDFTHFEQIRPEQLAEIEARVNEMITSDYPIKTEELPIAEARTKGAMMLFGEKYGERVRVVTMGPSVELCGGTHCGTTGQIGYFRIVSESSISAGVRRIEALTGAAAVADARRTDDMLNQLALLLKTRRETVQDRFRALQDEKAALERELESLRKKAANAAAGELVSQVKDVKGAKLLAAVVEGADANALRSTLDGIRKNQKDAAVVLAGTKEGRVALLVSFSEEIVKRGGHAGNLLKELAPKVGGKGGGKPDKAEGGGSEPAKAKEAVASAEALFAAMLK
ncbi:MAG TPA: alanine--tRNA ligase [Planctomycetota bacterium]|nr:alanine--tRNA ligase [Planctomycetota bacterium]